MDTIEAATNIVNHYTTTPAYLNSKQISFQFSRHNEITQNPKYQQDSKIADSPVNHVLLINVLNDTAPITIENLYQVCFLFCFLVATYLYQPACNTKIQEN